MMLKGGIPSPCISEPVRDMGNIDVVEYRNTGTKAEIEDMARGKFGIRKPLVGRSVGGDGAQSRK